MINSSQVFALKNQPEPDWNTWELGCTFVNINYNGSDDLDRLNTDLRRRTVDIKIFKKNNSFVEKNLPFAAWLDRCSCLELEIELLLLPPKPIRHRQVLRSAACMVFRLHIQCCRQLLQPQDFLLTHNNLISSVILSISTRTDASSKTEDSALLNNSDY